VKILIINNSYLGWCASGRSCSSTTACRASTWKATRLRQAGGRLRHQGLAHQAAERGRSRAEGGDGLERRPCLVEAEVIKEDNVFPMIPAGAALRDMIIERPKQKMAKPEGST
jgi:hypothetical protein